MKILTLETNEMELSKSLSNLSASEEVLPILAIPDPYVKYFDNLMDSAITISSNFIAEIGAEGWFIIL
jgi:hypothetical protein